MDFATIFTDDILPHEITLQDGTDLVPASGVPVRTAGASVTIKCFVQPTSASDGLLYQRDGTTRLLDVFLKMTDTTGAAYFATPNSNVIYAGAVYRVLGTPLNGCELGVYNKLVIENITQ